MSLKKKSFGIRLLDFLHVLFGEIIFFGLLMLFAVAIPLLTGHVAVAVVFAIFIALLVGLMGYFLVKELVSEGKSVYFPLPEIIATAVTSGLLAGVLFGFAVVLSGGIGFIPILVGMSVMQQAIVVGGSMAIVVGIVLGLSALRQVFSYKHRLQQETSDQFNDYEFTEEEEEAHHSLSNKKNTVGRADAINELCGAFMKEVKFRYLLPLTVESIANVRNKEIFANYLLISVMSEQWLFQIRLLVSHELATESTKTLLQILEVDREAVIARRSELGIESIEDLNTMVEMVQKIVEEKNAEISPSRRPTTYALGSSAQVATLEERLKETDADLLTADQRVQEATKRCEASERERLKIQARQEELAREFESLPASLAYTGEAAQTV